MTIAIANDHAGAKVKKVIIKFLKDEGHSVLNFGTDTEESVDYPDFISKAAESVQKNYADFGIVICGTGIGASITANKFKGVHAALCHDEFTAKMARNHNNANVIAVGARVLSEKEIVKLIDIFLKEPFLGDRHARRVNKIKTIEDKNFY